MSRWFRHYWGLARDEKLVRVAVRSGQPIERVIWVWTALLESACEVNDAGRFDFDAAEAAYFLRTDVSDIEAVLAGLADAGHVDENGVVKWSNRQFQSDSSAPRQARHRKRKQAQESDTDVRPPIGDGSVTASDRHSDGAVTPPDNRYRASVEADASTGADAPDEPPLDDRTRLFRDGLAALSAMSEKPAASLRPLLGRWLKLTGDDARAILDEIERCRGSPVADPVSWIEARLKPRPANARPPGSLDVHLSALASVASERIAARNAGGRPPDLADPPFALPATARGDPGTQGPAHRQLAARSGR